MKKLSRKHILWFKEIGIKDFSLVGGKNASLGEMFNNLSRAGIRVPNGFAVTTHAYSYFLEKTGIEKEIRAKLKKLKISDVGSLISIGREIRNLIRRTELPEELNLEIIKAYRQLGRLYFTNPDVAVRSSATAEDLPDASFAGAQETYLNISGEEELLKAVKNCFASLFNDRAISYRADQGFDHLEVSISVGVQKMVRSDLASSGVMFTIDTETGFDKAVIIESSYGLGESIVKGRVLPDEFTVFKPTLEEGFSPIIERKLGEKKIKLIYGNKGTKEIDVLKADQGKFSLTDGEVLELAKYAVTIEKHFSKRSGRVQPMDIEWAKDGRTGEISILQARPETVHSSSGAVHEEYELQKRGKILLTGVAVGSKIGQGRVRVAKSMRDISLFRKGEVLVTDVTDPDWEPIMKIAEAIVTNKGGRTSHAAIVSRELGIPCIVGSKDATRKLKSGDDITVDCSSGAVGKIYEGLLPFKIKRKNIYDLPKTRTQIMVNVGSPDEAFKYSNLPVKGVGLGRIEFIIAGSIKIHPNLLIDYEALKSSREPSIRKEIKKLEAITSGYPKKKEFYVDKLAEGIAKIASAFYPHDVIIRFSDFKTNEYRSLVGGALYEPEEENPMLGFRGASRYTHSSFRTAFGLECQAIKKVRDGMGLRNIIPMVPFCRTPEEGKRVLEEMRQKGLDRKKDKSLKVYIMCEVPSNVLLADKFLDCFDGMSIGSNDLTQLTMGMDRDSNFISDIADETNPAVKEFIKQVIVKCRARRKYIGICGQAPSDHPSFAKFLVRTGIKSISLNPDSVLKIIPIIAREEGVV